MAQSKTEATTATVAEKPLGFTLKSLTVETAVNGFIVTVQFRDSNATEYNRKSRTKTLVASTVLAVNSIISLYLSNVETAFENTEFN